MDQRLDVVIVGAGPAGLACGIEAKRRNLRFLIIEKGAIVDSLFHYPTHMTFFTTAELLEIGDVPMIVSTEKPTRVDGLKYYRRVADEYQLPIRDYEEVTTIQGSEGNFRVRTVDRQTNRHEYQAGWVIIATGFYSNPNYLAIPGENLPKASHYYSDPHPYFRKKVAVVGGRNSAAIVALELYRNGASEVTLIHRGEKMSDDVKYWILPDINNRLKAEEIRGYFRTELLEICPDSLVLKTPDEVKVIENDFVFLMTGYHPNIEFLHKAGIEIDQRTIAPHHDPETLESNVKGIYLAGAILSGRNTNEIFIENGRFHGAKILSRWPDKEVHGRD